MGLFKKRKKAPDLLLSDKDLNTFEKMVSGRIGNYDQVIHEIVSPDLHIDVIPVPPSENRDYYTLITMGMGGYRMPVPSNYGRMNRAEIAVRLPKDWNIHSNEGKYYWPIRVLKMLARMPYQEQSWLGLYHDIDFGDPFSEETELCGVMLDIFDEDIEPLTLESGDQLIVYNVIPIYRSEMEYKLAEGGESLVEKMSDEILHGPVDIHRTGVV